MNAADLLALAERCEKAERGTRGLDRLVSDAFGFRAWTAPRCRPFDGPKFTTSLDAAMTLADGLDRGRIVNTALAQMMRGRPNLHELGPREWDSLFARFVTAASLRAIASKAEGR